MYRYLLALTCLLVGTGTATAATWNGFQAAVTEKFITFFDASTVIKKGESVTLWVKYVNNEKFPDSDGSYATAQKMEYSCKKRTSRALNTSFYDKKHEFVKSSGASNVTEDIVPDTIGEDILKAVCTPDFPTSKSDKYYFPIANNDIFLFASNYFKNREAKYTDVAPTSAAKWNAFVHACDSTVSYYFDTETVEKKGDDVTFWVKYVKNSKNPDEDGSYSTAEKGKFSCPNNTVQFFNTSIYDKDGVFMRAFTKPSDVIQIKPNTFFLDMLTAACTPDFPNNKSEELYFPVAENDIYKNAATYQKNLEEKQTDQAPK